MRVNKILQYTLLLVLLVATSCERTYDAPLIIEPTVEEGLTPNLTIAEFKEKYAHVPDSSSELIDVDYVMKAVVIGNDISGNIYKQIYVEDETGGLSIGADQNNISGDYYIGQEVYIKLHGLSAVRYGGQIQIGMADTQANRIPYEIFKERVLRNGWPKEEHAEPKVITMGEMNDSHVGTLVQFDNVYFEGEGLTYADAVNQETVNRNIYDAQGRSVVVRNSGYADFAADLLPEGHGSVRGIFSKFGNTYQLFLRSKEDVFNFVPGLPSSGGGAGNDDPNTGGIDIGGGSGTSTTPEVTGSLLFPGSDFNDWNAFQATVNSYGLKLTEQSATGGVDGSGAAHLTGRATDGRNGYFFTNMVPADFDPSKVTKITFLIKGKVADKSISINVYNTNTDITYTDNEGVVKPAGYVAYNLGDLTKSSTFKADTSNSYTGSISTNGWIKVTLELTTTDGKKVQLPTKVGDNLIAFKYGHSADYDIYVDEIRFE